MENSEANLKKTIFDRLEKIVSPEWKESRINADKLIQSMRERQNNLSFEQAKSEALEQANRMRKNRIENKNF